MKRRELLAVGAAIAIAGCSDETSEPDQTESTGNGDEDDTDNSSDENGIEASSDEDDIDEGSDKNGNGEEEDKPEDEKEDTGPTEAELAQKHIDAAQEALSAAVSKIESQGKPNSKFGGSLNATVSLTPTPINDELGVARSELRDAGDFKTTADQDKTVNAIEASEAALRYLVNAQIAVNEVFVDAEYLLEDLLSAEFDAVRESETALGRDIDQIDSDVSRLTSSTESALGEDLSTVSAVTTDDLSNERDHVVTVYESLQPLVDASVSVSDAEETFRAVEEEYSENNGEEYQEYRQQYKAAQDDYETAESTFDEVEIAAVSEDIDDLECYTGHMIEAARYRSWEVEHWRWGEREQVGERSEQAGEELDNASDCGVFDHE